MGTKVSADSSFASNVNATIDTEFDVQSVGKFGASATTGFANTSTDSTSQMISKTQTLDIRANGNGDGVDHTQDAFIILLNPAVALREKTELVNGRCSAPAINWYVGLSGSPGTEQRYTLYVGWLRNPSSMPRNVAEQLKALSFTDDDYRNILSLDPFANGSTDIDQNRFIPTTYSFAYEPLLQETDCNNGTCSCMAISASIKNQLDSGSSSKSQMQYSVGFSEKLSELDLGIFKFGATSDQKFTWASSSTNEDTADSSQAATVTIACPSATYQGPTIISIYWDTLFGSFLFVPTELKSPLIETLHRGRAINLFGMPLPHEAVTLTVGTRTYHTWTNGRGEYTFIRSVGSSRVTPTTIGQLSIRGIKQPVNLGSVQGIRVPLP